MDECAKISFIAGNRIKIVISLTLALVSVFSLSRILIDDFTFLSYVLLLLLFVVLSALMYYVFSRSNKRTLIVSIVVGVIFSLLYAMGFEIQSEISFHYLSSSRLMFNLFTLAPLFIVLSAAFYTMIEGHRKRRKDTVLCSTAFQRFLRSGKGFFLIWLLLFAVYIIFGVLGVYPALYSYDAFVQLEQFHGTLNSHFPILHTLLLGVCFDAGIYLLSSATMGFLFYSLIQSLLFSAALAWFLHRLSRWAPAWIIVVGLLFFAIVPYHALMAVSTTKDTLFSTLFLLVALECFEMAVDSKTYFMRRSNLLRFIIFVLLMCLMRTNAILAFLVFVPIASLVLWMPKDQTLKFVASSVFAVILYCGINFGIYPLAGIDQVKSNEALSLPLQQIACVAVVAPEVFSEEQHEVLETIIPDYKDFSPGIADPIKNSAEISGNEEALVKLYVDIGLQRPKDYAFVPMRMTYAYWYPDAIYKDPACPHPYLEGVNRFEETYGHHKIEYKNYNNLAAKVFASFSSVSPPHQNIALLSLLFSPGFYTWLIIFTLGLSFVRKDRRVAIPCILMAAYALTLLFGPCALARYSYPFMVCLPLILSLWFSQGKKEGDKA